MALGATRASVVRLVLAHVSRLVAAGIVVGLAIGAWASRFAATLLFGLEPGDPGTVVASGSDIGAHRCGCWMASGAPRLTSRPDSDPARCVGPPDAEASTPLVPNL